MYILYVLYIRSSYILYTLRITLYNLSYYSSLSSFTGSILDYTYINWLASSNSSPNSYNIVLKASVIALSAIFTLAVKEVKGYYREGVKDRVSILYIAYILNLTVLILLPLYY